MSYREGLGYNLRYYDPAFSFNADRFCCSQRGAHHRQNVLLSETPLLVSDDYSRQRNNDPYDTRPMWMRTTGMVDPTPYDFTPQNRWYVWCSRMPCSCDQKGVPCQKHMTTAKNNWTCN